MAVQTAVLGNGTGRAAASTIWKASVRRSPRIMGTPGSNKASGKTIAAARAAAGRISGQVTRRQIWIDPAPASRAASRQAGSMRSQIAAVAIATSATVAGPLVQIQSSHFGHPLQDSRLTLPVAASLSEAGQAHRPGVSQIPSNPMARQAGGAASIEDTAARNRPRLREG